jgi:hypothetical protein
LDLKKRSFALQQDLGGDESEGSDKGGKAEENQQQLQVTEAQEEKPKETKVNV